MSQITDYTLPAEGRDGQHDPWEIPGLLEPLSNDAADLVIGFCSFGQSGFRALNKKATLSLAGTLKKDDFSIESEMMRCSHDMRLRMAEVQIQCRYLDFDTSAKNPVSHGSGVLRLGDLAYCREETAAVYQGSWIPYVSCLGLFWDTAASGV